MKKTCHFGGVVFAALVLLTGCLADVTRPLQTAISGDSAFDGVWIGQARFSIGSESCPRRGAALRAEIKGGGLDAVVRWTDQPSGFQGFIRDGVLESGAFRRAGFAFANVTGAFTEREAKGDWKSKECRGTWRLQKVRNF